MYNVMTKNNLKFVFRLSQGCMDMINELLALEEQPIANKSEVVRIAIHRFYWQKIGKNKRGKKNGTTNPNIN